MLLWHRGGTVRTAGDWAPCSLYTLNNDQACATTTRTHTKGKNGRKQKGCSLGSITRREGGNTAWSIEHCFTTTPFTTSVNPTLSQLPSTNPSHSGRSEEREKAEGVRCSLGKTMQRKGMDPTVQKHHAFSDCPFGGLR